MKNYPLGDRPYERLERHGAQMLSDSELLAIIISTGTTGKTALELAQDLRNSVSESSGLSDLAALTLGELRSFKGIGRVKAIKIAASLELGRRLQMNIAEPSPRLNSPQLIYQYMRSNYDFNEQEYLWTLNFNTKHELISCDLIAVGGLNRAAVSPREICRRAVKHNAFTVVIVHNHPSGNPIPSPQDYRTTNLIASAARTIGIPLTDHIVVADNGYVSIRQERPDLFGPDAKNATAEKS